MEIREEEGCGGTKVRMENIQFECGLAIMQWMLTMLLNREIQIFLIGFIVMQICEIFTIGGFPLDDAVRKVGSGVQMTRGSNVLTFLSRDLRPSM